MRNAEIVLVAFPFTNLETNKKRPALVLQRLKMGRSTEIVTVAMVTSKIEGPKWKGDVLLKHWDKANLLHPSLVRLAKVVTLETRLIVKTLGNLSPADEKSVRQEFQSWFEFWV